MATPGVGVLVDTDRLKDPSKQGTPYFIEVDAKRYYGKTPESAVKEAKKAFSAKSSTNIIPRKSKKQKQTSVTGPMADAMDADLKLLGVSKNATEAEIKAAWKKLVVPGHSNKGGTANVGAITAAKNRLIERLKAASPAAASPAAASPAPPPAAAKPLAIMNATATGGGKMRNSLKRRRTFRKKRSTTRKHLKRY